MDPNRPEPQPRHSIPHALFTGAFFGAIGAASVNWLATRTIPRLPGEKPGFGTRWLTILTGLFAGVVAFYSARRRDDMPPRAVFPEAIAEAGMAPKQEPQPKPAGPNLSVSGGDAHIDGVLAQQDRNLGL